ncbi:MAG TPA: TIGR02587 family membrane protein [Gemmatimonadales bacterium]|nr:TIGR02587 family membrane protein [Gemmatimonadales bacterium]
MGLARAFGGAIFFSLPLLMTMEMWQLGFHMPRLPLALFIVVMIPVLLGLEYYTGFKESTTWLDEVADAAVAYGVGIVASAVVLASLNLISTDEPLSSVLGKVALQAIPASFGAMLSNSQFGGEGTTERRHKREIGYGGTLFLMTVGAMFLSFNLAPTEEMILLAFRMTHWHAIALVLLSLLLIHGFVYASNFRGSPGAPEGVSRSHLFLHYTVPGYAIALLVSAYVLWTFGRYEDDAVASMVMQAVVLGFPASIGAAAARLVV